jgi:UTP--glucose-1-phosphate uridylyltransferase
MIKQAVIPAAGLGTRFLPVTKIVPKELLPIVERPALEFIVEELAESGIQEIVLVLSPEKESIYEYFSEGGFVDQMLDERGHGEKLSELRKLLKRIKFKRVYQKVPLGLGDAVLCAKREITDPFFTVVLPDDIVFSKKPCLKQLIDEHKKTKKNILAVEKVSKDRVSSYGIISTSEKIGTKKSFAVDHVVEKPKISEAPSNMAIIGRYILSKSIFDHLENDTQKKHGEIQLTTAIDKLVEEKQVRAFLFEGKRIDVGQPIGFVKANITFGLKHKKFGKEIAQFVKEMSR